MQPRNGGASNAAVAGLHARVRFAERHALAHANNVSALFVDWMDDGATA